MLKRSLVLALAVTVLVACAPTGPIAGLTPVPVTDYKMVAGKWGGVVQGMSAVAGSWASRRPSLAPYVTGTGATKGGRPLLEGANVDYPLPPHTSSRAFMHNAC
jgi:hypothetical protein